MRANKISSIPVLFVLLGFVTTASLSAWAASPAETPTSSTPPSQEKLAEYVKRLAAVSPRDAQGFYQVGRWCEAEGLQEQAIGAYQRALRIDPDHPPTRAALGYQSMGLGWIKGTPKSLQGKDPESQEPLDSSSTRPESEAVPKPEIMPKPVEPKREEVNIDEILAAKKRWAEEAAAKLAWTFSLYEDEDFLIHTTFPSAKVRELSSRLRKLKSLILAYTGRVQGPFWPRKLQFIYLRAATECMQFSEAIDGKRFPEAEGFYIEQDPKLGYHIVFSDFPEKKLGFFMGWSALDRMGSSDRFVSWWIKDGIGGLVAANTVEGKKERYIEQQFHLTASEIRGNPDGVTIFNILGSKGYGTSTQELQRSQAVTLVAYLYQIGRTKLQRLVADLKSPEAPAPPEGEDKFFFAQYIAFQERSITKNFRQKLEKLDQGWKEFVMKNAAEAERGLQQVPGAKKTGQTGKAAAGRSRTRGTGRIQQKKDN